MTDDPKNLDAEKNSEAEKQAGEHGEEQTQNRKKKRVDKRLDEQAADKIEEQDEKGLDEQSEDQVEPQTDEQSEGNDEDQKLKDEEPQGEQSKEQRGQKEGEKKKKQKDEKRMPFLNHLEELRWCLIRSIVAIGVAAIGAFLFASYILNFLMRPYILLPDELRRAPMQYLSPAGGFMINIKVAVFAGLIIALPYVFYEIWKFIVPGLLNKERKFAPTFIIATTFCFLAGAAFAFLVILPFGLRFLSKFQSDWMVANLRIEDYLSFVTRVILAFGVVFELPVLSFLLTKMGLLTPQFLSSKRRYGIVLVFIIAAILTPPDPLTQMMMAAPLLVLYEISVIVSRLVVKKEDKAG